MKAALRRSRLLAGANARAPRFIVVAGPPCAGKSTIARHLGDALGAPHLEMDRILRRAMPQSDHRVSDRNVAYRAMHVAAELMAPWTGTVILDATYSAAVCRADLAQIVTRANGRLFVIECHVAPDLAVARFRRREGHPAADLAAAHVETLAAAYRHFSRACAVSADEPAGFSGAAVTRHLAGPPLDTDCRARWCGLGQDRDEWEVSYAGDASESHGS